MRSVFARQIPKERLSIDVLVGDSFQNIFVFASGPEAECMLGMSLAEYKSKKYTVADILTLQNR